MPAFGRQQPPTNEVPETLKDFMERQTKYDPVTEQIAALRQEIMELRLALSPPQSIVITGPEVRRMLEQLKGKEKS